jgi:HD superfamily phosphohydrolase YqeK
VAASLAARHGSDLSSAAIVGLCHDRSKPMTPEEIESDLRRRGVRIPADDRDHPSVWHGLHAAVVAREGGILAECADPDDAERAIALHSTADADASPLLRTIFLADFLEPGREFETADRLRALARENLSDAFREALRDKCSYMKAKGKKLSARAERALAATE